MYIAGHSVSCSTKNIWELNYNCNSFNAVAIYMDMYNHQTSLNYVLRVKET